MDKHERKFIARYVITQSLAFVVGFAIARAAKKIVPIPEMDNVDFWGRPTA